MAWIRPLLLSCFSSQRIKLLLWTSNNGKKPAGSLTMNSSSKHWYITFQAADRVESKRLERTKAIIKSNCYAYYFYHLEGHLEETCIIKETRCQLEQGTRQTATFLALTHKVQIEKTSTWRTTEQAVWCCPLPDYMFWFIWHIKYWTVWLLLVSCSPQRDI